MVVFANFRVKNGVGTISGWDELEHKLFLIMGKTGNDYD